MKTSSGIGCAVTLVAGVLLAGFSAVQAQTCFSDAFTYPDGALLGNGSWVDRASPPLGAGDIAVLGNQVLLTSTPDGVDSGNFSTGVPGLSCVACASTGKITVAFKIKAGGANTAGSGYVGHVDFWDSNGRYVARFDLYATAVRFRLGAGIVGLPNVTISSAGFDELKAVIDVVNTNTAFFHTPYLGTEVSMGTLDWNAAWAANSSLAAVDILDDDSETAGTGTYLIDDMSVLRCEGSCFMDVDPLADEPIMGKTSFAAVGGAVYDPTHVWTVTNTGAVPINWTAAEADAAGNGVDYPWLSLFPTSGGPLAPLGTADVTATWSSGLLPAGIYAGNIKYDNDCDSDPATYQLRTAQLVVGSVPCFVDAFQYPNGNLDAHGGWAGTDGTPSSMQVAADPDNAGNQVVKLNFIDSTGFNAILGGLGCLPCEDDTITVLAKIKGSATGADVGRAWSLEFIDSQGNSLATWHGDYNDARGRTAAGGLATASGVVDTTFHELKAIINIKNNTTTYYFDGGLMSGNNPQTHGADLYSSRTNVGDRVESVSLKIFGDNSSISGHVFFDDIQVISCSGTCLGRVSSDRSQVGFTDLPYAKLGDTTATRWDGDTQTYVPYYRDYAFNNDGLDTMSYTVAEVDADGNALDYPWMSLSKLAGGPVAPFTGDPDVTISYDTTGLTNGLHRGFIKFTDTCAPDRSYLRAIQLNVGDVITEDFAYPDGSLESMPGWRTGQLNQTADVPQQPSGTTNPIPIEVVGGRVRVHGKPTDGTIEATHQMIDNCPFCPTGAPYGLIVVKATVKGTANGGGSRYWYLTFANNTGEMWAGWAGSAEFVEGHMDGELMSSLNDGNSHQLMAYINFNTVAVEGVAANATRYFFDGTRVGTTDSPIPLSGVESRIRIIRIWRDPNAVADANPVIEIDNVSVSACAPVCGAPVFDVNRDGKVNMDDLQTVGNNGLIDCATGPSPDAAVFDALSFQCKCLDINHDKAVDMLEFAAFQRCVSSGMTPPGSRRSELRQLIAVRLYSGKATPGCHR